MEKVPCGPHSTGSGVDVAGSPGPVSSRPWAYTREDGAEGGQGLSGETAGNWSLGGCRCYLQVQQMAVASRRNDTVGKLREGKPVMRLEGGRTQDSRDCGEAWKCGCGGRARESAGNGDALQCDYKGATALS